MKKLILTSAALLVFAGSTLSAPALTTSKAPTKTDSVPVAKCPYNDPNGCGILD